MPYKKITKLEKTIFLQSNRAYDWLKGALIQNKFKF